MPKPSALSLIEESWTHPIVIGHRGAAAYRAENRIEGFEVAIGMGVAATECDVHVSRDGELMVIHDHTLDRTTSLTGPVKDRLASEMIAAGVPTLAMVCAVTRDRIVLVVEIKGGVGVVEKVIEALGVHDMASQSIVFSFNPDFIRRAKELEPALCAVWLIARLSDFEAILAELEDMGADGLGLHFSVACEDIVTGAHARRLPVFVWTVPPGREAARLKGIGVNFIITDHPGEILKELRQSGN